MIKNMLLPRYFENLNQFLLPKKILVIYGPRQVGKTTLLKNFLKTINLRYKLVTGDDLSVQEILSSQKLKKLSEFCAGYQLLVIDEAQKIPNIGINLKLIVDNIPDLKLIVTGSSSFDLSGQIGEPLTGRKITLTLYPLSQLELIKINNPYELKEKLSDFLIFGIYK
jgi:predicted AAA+ superfamily ATPase